MEFKESMYNLSFQTDDEKTVYYNTYSGSLIILENSLIHYIDRQEFAQLYSQGFFIESNINEVNKLIIEQRIAVFNPRPEHLFFSLAPTFRCQAKCDYCFEKGLLHLHDMIPETAYQVASYIQNSIHSCNARSIRVNLFGGEPLLALSRIEEIMSSVSEYCNKENVNLSSRLVTNGILFTREVAIKLVKLCKLSSVQITLDGLKDSHNKIKGINCFESIIDNIQNTYDLTKIIIRINVTKKNQDEVPELINLLTTNNLFGGHIRIYLAQVTNGLGCSVDEVCMQSSEFSTYRNKIYTDYISKCKFFSIDDVLPIIKRNVCAYQRFTNACIGPQGELYKCERHFGNNQCSIGDVLNPHFYNDIECLMYRDIPNHCIFNKCPLLPLCFGGCPDSPLVDGSIECETLLSRTICNLRLAVSRLTE